MKIVCYGVRSTDVPFFVQASQDFGYDIITEKELLTDNNIRLAQGCEAVLVRANCPVNKQNLDIFKSYGVKYILTRTVATNHIDIEYAKQLGFKMARVPAYSPNSVSELVVGLGLGLMRNIFIMANNCEHKNFIVSNDLFAKEVRNSTIGIVGTGKIGIEVAKSFKGMGAKILGYDLYPNDQNEEFLKYVDLDTLLKESDLVTLHIPYIKGINDNFVNYKFLNKMKKESFLINAARGELVDNEALYEAVINGKLKGVALDTIKDETKLYFKDFKDLEPIEIYQKFLKLYPKIIMTPHVGSYTDEATKNMVEISFQNLKDLIENKETKNQF